MADYQAAGGRVSSNAFANGSNQNCGNVLTERPSTRLHAPPGGKTSLSLGWGGDEQPLQRRAPANGGEPPAAWSPAPAAPAQSPQAPGYGRSGPSGGAPRDGRVSSNAFATGSNQNCGNVLTDVSSTRVAAPPGGSSSLNLGWNEGAAQERSALPEQWSPSRDPRSSQNERSYASRAPPPAHFMSANGAPGGMQGGSRSGGYGGGGNGRVMVNRSPPSPPDSPQGGSSFAAQMQQSPDRPGPGQNSVTYGQRGRVSSNSFASGADQNCGNVITGVPTTRVSRPPGGSSGINLSWDAKQDGMPREVPDHRGAPARSEEAPVGRSTGGQTAFGVRPRVSSNTYANGGNQNCGNVISDTPTTRVLRPPGGSSSLSLGWD